MGAGHAHPSALTGGEGTKAGLRAIRLSLVALSASAALRLTIAFLSGSVGLLAAGLDDLGDVLTTIALSLAFVASRKAADKRYTFGYQRLEDLSGVLVVLVIWASAAIATYEGFTKLSGHHVVSRIGIAVAAGAIGLAANGFAGFYKIAVGKRIGSEPLIADGKHALTDGLASIAAIVGLIGVRMGARWADPVAGLAVAVAIAFVAVRATQQVVTRLLDVVDPALTEHIESLALAEDRVQQVGRVQARWAGRSLYVSLTVAVEGDMPLRDAHEVAEHLHHKILHEVSGVAQVDIHVDPWEAHSAEAHDHTTAHNPKVRSDHHEPVEVHEAHDGHAHEPHGHEHHAH